MKVLGLWVVVVLGCSASQAVATPPPSVLVSFEQSGGFAGIERSLVVYRTGNVVSDGFAVKTHRLSPARLGALRDVLVKARFATLERTYESDPPVADGYLYRITYARRSVNFEEGAKLPVRLHRVYAFLGGLLRN